MTSPSRGTDLQSAALGYAKRGWRVFPLLPRDKAPRVKEGFKVATNDRDAVLAWWSQWPDSNIGLATGHEFDVLDIDGQIGIQSLQDYLMFEGISFHHVGPMALTGKGLHLLFQPTGSGNRAGLLPNVDFRGLGGYIVAPPSIHPSGHSYRWNENRGPDTGLLSAPEWLMKLLDTNRAKNKAAPRGISNEYAPTELPVVKLTVSGRIGAQRPSIEEVARGLNLYVVKQGATLFARCPFHKGYAVAQQHEGTPSMQLDTIKNNFYCHSCHVYGDSHDLLKHRSIDNQTF